MSALLLSTTSVGQANAVEEENNSFYQGQGYQNGGYQKEAGTPLFSNWSYNLTKEVNKLETVKWDFDMTSLNSKSLPFSTAVDKDDNSYFVNRNYELVSIDKNGKERWKKTYENRLSMYAAPQIGKNGVMYLVATYGIYGVNSDGEVIWESKLGSNYTFNSNLTIGEDGTLYAVSSGKLVAINPDGSLKWASAEKISLSQYKSPIVSKDGTIYIDSSSDKTLYAFNSDGELKWKKSIEISTTSHLTLTNEGKIVATYSYTNMPGKVFILNSDGETEKEIELDKSGGNFVIYNEKVNQIIVQNVKKLSSFNVDGTKNWEYEFPNTVWSHPIIDKNGTIYASSNGGLVTALNPDGTVKEVFDIAKHFGGNSGNFGVMTNNMQVTTDGNLRIPVMVSFFGADSKYLLIELGNEPAEMPDDICEGYLEDVEKQLKDGTISQEKIDEAQLRLSKTLYELSQKEQ